MPPSCATTSRFPPHGTINGALLHILAAETLSQDIALTPAKPLLALLLVSSLVIALVRSHLGRRPTWLMASLLALAAAIELGALALQAGAQIMVSTPALHAALFGIASLAAAREFHLRRKLLVLTRVAMRNRRNILGRIPDGPSLHRRIQETPMSGCRA